MFKVYHIWGRVKLILFKIRGYFLFSSARIIRFPFYVRGKRFIEVGNRLTTGYNCRLDAFPIIKEGIIIKIGNNVQINDYVHIAGIESIIIEDNVLIASKVFITDHNHGKYSGEEQDSPLTPPNIRKLYSSSVKIEENVWIGEFVSILPGVTIGKGSIIGSNSVVNKDIPPFSIAVGCPAKVIKKYDFELEEWVNIKN